MLLGWLLLTEGQEREWVKELLVFGTSLVRVCLRWYFPVIQCSLHFHVLSCPIYVLMKSLVSNKEKERKVEEGIGSEYSSRVSLSSSFTC